MRRAVLGVAIVVLLAIPTTSFGWFSLFSRSSHRSAGPAVVYYCPLPVAVTVPVAVPAPFALPAPLAAPSPYAVPAPPVPPPAPPWNYAEPRPAPPSGTGEPPRAPDLMPRAGVNTQESRKVEEKFYDSYFVAGGTQAPGPDRCVVTFWNLSGQDLRLTVDGSLRPVPSGQKVRLELNREFRWGVAGREAVGQQVPAAETGVEIVIRRP